MSGKPDYHWRQSFFRLYRAADGTVAGRLVEYWNGSLFGSRFRRKNPDAGNRIWNAYHTEYSDFDRSACFLEKSVPWRSDLCQWRCRRNDIRVGDFPGMSQSEKSHFVRCNKGNSEKRILGVQRLRRGGVCQQPDGNRRICFLLL